VVGGLAMLVAVAAVVVITQTGSRLPGQTPTGSVSLSRPEQIRRTLAQAESLELSGDGAGALRLYHQVLTQDPGQAEALAEAGWLEFEAGVAAKSATVISEAVHLEHRAVGVAPGAYAAHLYLGSMLLAQGDAQGAVAQYRAFLADGPPAAKVRAATPFIVRAFTRVGLPVPPLPS
jgi:tetratricopeptide (TPR) repeat protein